MFELRSLHGVSKLCDKGSHEPNFGFSQSLESPEFVCSFSFSFSVSLTFRFSLGFVNKMNASNWAAAVLWQIGCGGKRWRHVDQVSGW